MAEELELEEELEESEEESEDESDLDYKSLYEAEKAKADKSENDRRAARGSLRSQQERDDVIYGLEDKVSALGSSLNIFIKNVSKSGEMEGLQQEIAEADAQTAQKAAVRDFTTQYSNAHEMLMEAWKDDDGNSVFDPNSADIKDFVAEWNEAHSKGDIATLFMLTTEAHKERRQFDRQQVTSVDKEEKTVKRKARQKAGSLDLGPASGGSSSSEKSALQKIEDGLKKHDIIVARS